MGSDLIRRSSTDAGGGGDGGGGGGGGGEASRGGGGGGGGGSTRLDATGWGEALSFLRSSLSLLPDDFALVRFSSASAVLHPSSSSSSASSA
jgi:hypothetical protein